MLDRISTVIFATMVATTSTGCESTRPKADAGPFDASAATDATAHSSTECATYAERACAAACACEPTCRFYYPSHSSQSFGTMENCANAMVEYCSTATFDMIVCDVELEAAMCAPDTHGSGFELPAECFSL